MSRTRTTRAPTPTQQTSCEPCGIGLRLCWLVLRLCVTEPVGGVSPNLLTGGSSAAPMWVLLPLGCCRRWAAAAAGVLADCVPCTAPCCCAGPTPSSWPRRTSLPVAVAADLTLLFTLHLSCCAGRTPSSGPCWTTCSTRPSTSRTSSTSTSGGWAALLGLGIEAAALQVGWVRSRCLGWGLRQQHFRWAGLASCLLQLRTWLAGWLAGWYLAQASTCSTDPHGTRPSSSTGCCAVPQPASPPFCCCPGCGATTSWRTAAAGWPGAERRTKQVRGGMGGGRRSGSGWLWMCFP